MSQLRNVQRGMVIFVAIANAAVALLMLVLGAERGVEVPLLIPLVLLIAAALLLAFGLRMR